MQEYKDIVKEEHMMKPKLFTYPNWNEAQTVFDFEDLADDALLVLCIRAQLDEPGQDQHRVFVWRGAEFDEEEANQEVVNVQEFVNKVMEQYWGCKQAEFQFNIGIFNEYSGRESDEFNDFF